MTDSKTVSLALGSGGARGLAHIGVIRCIEEHGYRITSIAGSSMGALIGGIYAAGKLDIYTEWVKALRKTDVLRLLDFSYSRTGFFSGERIMQKLREMLGDAMIEDLPVAFTAVATDLDRGREKWFNRGSLFYAIRASIAIPSVFTPVNHHGRLLVDGGVLNPVPIAPTLRDISELTVAVSLSGKEDPSLYKQTEHAITQQEENSYHRAISSFIEGLQERFNLDERDETNMIDVVTRSVESMQNTIARFKVAAYNPDYLLEVPVNACGVFEFYRAEEMITLGYELTHKMLSERLHAG